MLWSTSLYEEVEFWLWHALALQLWANDLPSPSLSFLSPEMGLIVEPVWCRTDHGDGSKAPRGLARKELMYRITLPPSPGQHMVYPPHPLVSAATHGQDSEAWGPRVWEGCPTKSVHVTLVLRKFLTLEHAPAPPHLVDRPSTAHLPLLTLLCSTLLSAPSFVPYLLYRRFLLRIWNASMNILDISVITCLVCWRSTVEGYAIHVWRHIDDLSNLEAVPWNLHALDQEVGAWLPPGSATDMLSGLEQVTVIPELKSSL